MHRASPWTEKRDYTVHSRQWQAQSGALQCKNWKWLKMEWLSHGSFQPNLLPRWGLWGYKHFGFDRDLDFQIQHVNNKPNLKKSVLASLAKFFKSPFKWKKRERCTCPNWVKIKKGWGSIRAKNDISQITPGNSVFDWVPKVFLRH